MDKMDISKVCTIARESGMNDHECRESNWCGCDCHGPLIEDYVAEQQAEEQYRRVIHDHVCTSKTCCVCRDSQPIRLRRNRYSGYFLCPKCRYEPFMRDAFAGLKAKNYTRRRGG